MAVGRPGHIEASPKVRDHFGVVPIRALTDIGLLSPNLREGGWKIAIPIIEAEVDSAHDLEKPRTSRVAQHGHCRNGREAHDPVGSKLLDRVDIGGTNQLHDLVPTHTAEATLAPRDLVGLARFWVVLDRRPSCDGVSVRRLLFSEPEVPEGAPNQGILDPQRAIEVPREGDPSLATSRLIWRKPIFEEGIIELLGLPDHNPFLDMNLPGATPCAVHTMGASHNLVVLEPVPVELLPLSRLWRDDVLNPTHVFPFAFNEDSSANRLQQNVSFPNETTSEISEVRHLGPNP